MESIWVIGDVHGCRDSLDALLARPEIADDPRCRFWFVGDLVNRGPASAATLRRVRALGERATVVLGNHDLRALAVAAGCLRPGRRDTLDELLRARDATSLLDWLRRQPLLHAEAGHLLVHAGLYPRWDPATAMARAGGRGVAAPSALAPAPAADPGAVAAVLARHNVGRGQAEVHCPGVHPDAALPPRRHIGAARQGRAGTLAIRHAALVRRPGPAGGAGSSPFWPLGNAGIAGAVGRGVPGYRVRIRRRIDSPAPG